MVEYTFEEIKKYLPQYLCDESINDLFKEINCFQNSGYNNNLYTNQLYDKTLIFQGDVLNEMQFIFFPAPKVFKTLGMVLSNTCDINIENSHFSDIQICYAPIFKLQNYIDGLHDKFTDQQIEDHIKCIKNQRYTTIMYLPSHLNGPTEDAIVLLDKICNCDSSSIERTKLTNRRFFTLNNFGLYLYLLKISIHFTRIRESIDRDKGLILN